MATGPTGKHSLTLSYFSGFSPTGTDITHHCEQWGVFLIPSRIFSISCIQLRQLVPSGRDAINKLKGKTGKRRLFFMIHYMLGGFDLCVMQSRIKPCLTIIYSTGHRQRVSCLAQCLAPCPEGETGKKKMLGPPCLGVRLQLRVQKCVCVFSLLSCGSRKVSPSTTTGSRQGRASPEDTASSLTWRELALTPFGQNSAMLPITVKLLNYLAVLNASFLFFLGFFLTLLLMRSDWCIHHLL